MTENIGSSSCNLVYGMKDGRLVHVSDVARGLASGCSCPKCGDALVAKQGSIVSWHFAHESGAECLSAPETALHMLAKEILAKAKLLFLPTLGVVCPDGTYDTLAGYKWDRADRIELEPDYGTVRPDAAVTCGSATYFVEIIVANGVDDVKMAKLKGIGHSVIGIDLSGVPRDISRADLEVMILRPDPDAPSCGWVWHPARDAYLEKKEAALLRKKEAAGRRSVFCPACSAPMDYMGSTPRGGKDVYRCRCGSNWIADGSSDGRLRLLKSHECVLCGRPMALRKGRTPFWGCTGYPKCTCTDNDFPSVSPRIRTRKTVLALSS